MSVVDLITKKPLLPVVEITKNDASTYTYNPFTSTFDFYVVGLTVTPAHDVDGGVYSMEITSSDATNSAMNTVLTNIEEGNELLIYIGKDNTNKSKIFRGVIESIEIYEQNKNYMYVTISGPDWGSDVLKNRVVTGQWAQLRASDGTLDASDTATTVSQITHDLLTQTSSYPTGDIAAGDATGSSSTQGIIVPAVDDLEGKGFPLSVFNANYEPLDDKLHELDEIAGIIHYVDPDKNYVSKAPTDSTSSLPADILLTDDNTDATALAWPPTKVGLIAPGSTLKRTLEHHRRRLFGLGGENIEVDQSSETDAGSTKIHDTNYAMSFTPEYITLNKVHVLISRVGTPDTDFVLEIREAGSNGLPTGEVLRTVSKNKAFMNGFDENDPKMSSFEINEDLNTANTYWIVLRKGGGDANNTFQWHHDNTDNNPSLSASSADDVTWALTTTPNRFNYGFRSWRGTPVFSILEQNDSIQTTDKHFHEETIRKADVTEQDLMKKLLTNQTNTFFKRKEIFTASIYAPDTLLQTGQSVRIRKQASGYTFDADWVIGNVTYIFESDETNVTGAFRYDIEAIRYVTIS
jgi:hypothetical protein